MATLHCDYALHSYVRAIFSHDRLLCITASSLQKRRSIFWRQRTAAHVLGNKQWPHTQSSHPMECISRCTIVYTWWHSQCSAGGTLQQEAKCAQRHQVRQSAAKSYIPLKDFSPNLLLCLNPFLPFDDSNVQPNVMWVPVDSMPYYILVQCICHFIMKLWCSISHSHKALIYCSSSHPFFAIFFSVCVCVCVTIHQRDSSSTSHVYSFPWMFQVLNTLATIIIMFFSVKIDKTPDNATKNTQHLPYLPQSNGGDGTCCVPPYTWQLFLQLFATPGHLSM